jgi:hypothetical protein
MGSNKPSEKYLSHYTPECPICKGVLLPEKVEELEQRVTELTISRAHHKDLASKMESEVRRLMGELNQAKAQADQWRDLYQARGS